MANPRLVVCSETIPAIGHAEATLSESYFEIADGLRVRWVGATQPPN